MICQHRCICNTMLFCNQYTPRLPVVVKKMCSFDREKSLKGRNAKGGACNNMKS